MAIIETRALYAASLGRVLRRLRGGTSQAALATHAGLSTSALSRFETGQTMPDLLEARDLARALGVGVARLAELSEDVFCRAAKILQKTDAGAAAIGGAVTIAAALTIPEETAPATRSRKDGEARSRRRSRS